MVEDKYIVPFSCWIDEIEKIHGDYQIEIETIKEIISHQKMHITDLAIRTIIKIFSYLFAFIFL
jgi:hypothetical protein